MCGRVVVALDSETLATIARAKEIRNEIRFKQSYNIAPGRYIPASYKEHKQNVLEAMKWGTTNKDGISLSNARSENFSIYYKNWKRCVIVINGYYEWKKIIAKNDEDKILASQPYFIKGLNIEYLTIAGVYKDSLDEVVFIELGRI